MKNFEYEELAPSVFLYKKVINNFDLIIEMANKDDFIWDDAKISDGQPNNFTGIINKEIRNTKNSAIYVSLDKSIVWFDTLQKIWNRADHYAKYFSIYFKEMETPQLLFYPKGEGFYKPHYDDGPEMKRIFSSILYLNNIEIGGETYFPYFDLTVKPNAGDMVIFPSNYTFIHEAKSPISDDKYVIVTWYDQ